MEDVPGDAEAIAHIQKRMHAFGVYEGAIVSADGKGTILAVKPADDRYQYPKIYDLVKEKIAELKARGGSEQFFVSGRPIIEGVFGQYMPAEMQRMQPMVMALLLLLLFLAFRSPRGVLMPILVVVLAEIWMLGTMAAMGVPMFTVTTMLPILILAIGIADAVHFMSRERLLAHQQSYPHRRNRIEEVMHELWKPMLMTSVTTGAGFLSMLTSDIAPIKYFGIFAAIGVTYAFIITLLLLPALLMLLKDRQAGARKPLFSAYVEWQGNTVLTQHKRILAIFGVLLAISCFGLSQLYVNASLVAQFKPSDPLRMADTILNQHFSGTNTLDLMIDTGKQDGLLEPDGVGAVGLLFQDGSGADVRPAAHVGTVEEDRAGKIAALELDVVPELAVVDRGRRLRPNHTARPDGGKRPENAATGMDRCALGNAGGIDLFVDLHSRP